MSDPKGGMVDGPRGSDARPSGTMTGLLVAQLGTVPEPVKKLSGKKPWKSRDAKIENAA